MNLNRIKKRISLTLILFIISVSPVLSQETLSGIYLNPHDFTEGKLSFAFRSNSSGKIKLNDFLASSLVDVTVNGKITRLSKDSIFGYRNSKNETYRFYKKHDEEFRILENKSIVLYLSYKRISSNNGKPGTLVPTYFFSKTTDSEVFPLTISNLKKSFPDNMKFHDMLDTEFGNGEELSVFSTTNKMYKINYLLSQTTL